MKNLRKRAERLEKILEPVKRLQESKKLKDDSSELPKLSFEERQGIREAWESLELRTSSLIDKAIREGTLDPSLKEEARKAIYGFVADHLAKKRAEREKEKDEKEKNEKITENSKSNTPD